MAKNNHVDLKLFDKIPAGIAVYEPYRKGQNFVFVDFNRTAEKIEGMKKKELIGKRVTEVFPGIKKMGLLDVFRTVYKTGRAVHHPISMYQDRELVVWRENFVYKLPNGSIVAIYTDETEKKKSEFAIKESEERYQMAMKGTSDGVWDWDIPTNKVYYSDRWKEMIGYKSHELENDFSSWEKNLHPDDVDRCVRYVSEYVKTGGKKNFHLEFQMKHKKGHYVFILARAFLVKTRDGKPIRMVGTHIDLTEQKQVERELERYRDRTLEVRNEIVPILQRVALGDFSKNVSIPKIEDDYTELFVSINLMIEDLKELNQEMDKKIHKVTNTLRESEERFRRVFKDSAIGIATVSLEGKFLNVNTSLCKILGYTEKELLQKTFQNITHPDDLQTDLAYIEQMLDGKIQTYSMEKRYFRKNGNVIWVLLSVSLVRDSNNKPLFFVSQIQDIDDRKRVEERITERTFELEQMNKFMIGRELRMIELKKKLSVCEKELKKKYGKEK